MNESISSAGKGVLLGLANLLVIAGGAAAMTASLHGAVLITISILLLGFMPAMAFGGLLGLLAGRVDARPLARFALLAVLALVATGLVGAVLHSEELILPAFIPTLVCASILERWTRSANGLPAARVA